MKFRELVEAKEASIDLDNATDLDLANFVLNAAAAMAARNFKNDDNLEGDELVNELELEVFQIIKKMNSRVDDLLHGGGDRNTKIIKANMK
jgi:hypothetical protein